MDDSFRVRVEKVFGSLSSSPASAAAAAAAAPPPSNMWCLSDEEIEKREVNRDDLSDGSPSDSDDDDDDDDNGGDGDGDGDGDGEEPRQPNNALSQQPLTNDVVDTGKPELDEDWEIRSAIGRDCTLDFEEEADEFDKLAVGLEEFGDDRFYDREIDDYGVDYYDPNPIATSFEDVVDRDPRADRMAAKLRLIEDSGAAAGDFVSPTLPGASTTLPIKLNEEDKVSNPKPILKKREKRVETRSQKRVRFSGDDDSSPSQGCSKEDTSLSEEEDSPQEPPFAAETKVAEASSSMDEPTSPLKKQVPDYIQNPSRYTRYTLDSADEVDEASNRKAFMEFSKLVSKPKADDLQPDEFDPSFPPIFTPKSKTRMDEDSSPMKMDTMSDADNPVVITPAADTDDGVCAMDEDLQEDDLNRNRGSNKASRRYRSRTIVNHDDIVA